MHRYGCCADCFGNYRHVAFISFAECKKARCNQGGDCGDHHAYGDVHRLIEGLGGIPFSKGCMERSGTVGGRKRTLSKYDFLSYWRPEYRILAILYGKQLPCGSCRRSASCVQRNVRAGLPQQLAYSPCGIRLRAASYLRWRTRLVSGSGKVGGVDDAGYGDHNSCERKALARRRIRQLVFSSGKLDSRRRDKQ